MRIIGIDPGYAITGFGVIEYNGNHFELIKAGAIETKAGVPFPNRLQKIYDDWLTQDGTLRESLNFSIDKSVNSLTSSYIKRVKEARESAR